MKKKNAEWAGVSAPALRLPDLQALIAGDIPFVLIPRYLSPDWCSEIMRRFLAAPLEDHAYGRDTVRQLGLSVAPMVSERAVYFDRAPEITADMREIYRGGEDPLLKLRRDAAACTGWDCVPALEGGQPYATDMIGAVVPGSGVVLHNDSPLLQPDLFVAQFPTRLSWNVYLSESRYGGALTVYRRAYDKRDAALHHGFEGYEPGVIAGGQKAEYRPSPGDLLLFDAAHFHEVELTSAEGLRVSAHAWMGVDPARARMTFWS